MSPLYKTNDKLLVKNGKLATSADCCCDPCCIIGDGKGTIFRAANGGSTCWGLTLNTHIFFSHCSLDTITIKGLGIIGQIDQPTIEANVKYNGEFISISPNPNNCPINTAIIRTSRIDCITISAQGSRNTGTAQGWEHSPGVDPIQPDSCGSKQPGLVGGQGAYTITISNLDPVGNFLVYIKLGCNTAQARSNPLFPNSPDGKNGTYFYVAGDNQNSFGNNPILNSTLNGQRVLICGPEGRMIEKNILPNFGNLATWRVRADCIVWLAEGWIVPA